MVKDLQRLLKPVGFGNNYSLIAKYNYFIVLGFQTLLGTAVPPTIVRPSLKCIPLFFFLFSFSLLKLVPALRKRV